MVLNLGIKQTIGQRAGQKLIAKQDILKFGSTSLKLLHETGPPIGQYDVGGLFFNAKDRKLYIVDNFLLANTPTLFYYKLNGNGQDFSTGARNDLTTAGDPVYGPGRNAKAITLDGTDDKLIIPTAVNWDLDTAWSFGCLVKLPTDFANGEEVYLLEAYVDATHWFIISIVGNATPKGNIRVRYQAGGFDRDTTGTDIIDLNKWESIWIRHEGTGNTPITGYVNTDDDAFGNFNLGLVGSTGDFEIGRSQKDSSFGNNAYIIDDVKAWSDTARAPTSLDWIDLDKNHWTSYEGTFVEAI